MELYNQFEPQKLINIFKLLPFSLAIYLTFIGYGIKTSVSQLTRQPLLPKSLMWVFLNNYLIIPSIVTLTGIVLNLPPLMILALLLICFTQGGGFAYVTTWLLRGNQHIQFWQILFNMILAVIALPTMLAFFGQINPRTSSLMLNIQVDSHRLLLESFQNIFFPFLIGMTLRQLTPQIAGFLANKLIGIGLFVMGIFLMIDYSTHFNQLRQYWNAYYYLLIAYNLLVIGLTFSVPMQLGYGYKTSVAIALGSSQLNFFLIMTILNTYFKNYTSTYMTVLMWSWTSIIIPLGLKSIYSIIYYLYHLNKRIRDKSNYATTKGGTN